MSSSEVVKDILAKLTSVDRALRDARIWTKDQQQMTAVLISRRTDIEQIREYLQKHLIVVIGLQERLREEKEARKRLEETIARSPVTPVDARETYGKQIDNLTF
tara:strand:+ start:137 stop:448 length:312 start_codon:yes stop_codon:yes gene_type:complete